jgi:hypothetical protein
MKPRPPLTSVFERKSLGYSFWVAAGGKIKRRVADKAKATFKARVRRLTRRSGEASLEQVVERLGSMCWVGGHTSERRKLQRSGASWISAYATGCGPSI